MVREALAAHARQHRVQAAAVRARVRDAWAARSSGCGRTTSTSRHSARSKRSARSAMASFVTIRRAATARSAIGHVQRARGRVAGRAAPSAAATGPSRPVGRATALGIAWPHCLRRLNRVILASVGQQRRRFRDSTRAFCRPGRGDVCRRTFQGSAQSRASVASDSALLRTMLRTAVREGLTTAHGADAPQLVCVGLLDDLSPGAGWLERLRDPPESAIAGPSRRTARSSCGRCRRADSFLTKRRNDVPHAFRIRSRVSAAFSSGLAARRHRSTGPTRSSSAITSTSFRPGTGAAKFVAEPTPGR